MNHAEVKRRQLQAFSVILACVVVLVMAGILGYNGVAYVAVAAEVCFLVWTLVSGGVSDVLGRLLRGRSSRGQYRNAAKLRRNVLLIQMGLGLLGSVLLFAGAGWLAQKVFKVQYATLILMVMAPAVFLRSVSAVLLGYFQGEGTELPTVVTAFLRQVFILGFGLLFGRMQSGYGEKVSRLLGQENFAAMHGGVGVAIAVSLSEVFIILFLVLMSRGKGRLKAKEQQDGMRVKDSFWDSIRLSLGSRAIQTGVFFLAVLPLPLGLCLSQRSAADGDAAAVQYGVYAAGYLAVCAIPAAFSLISLLPSVSRTVICLRKEEQRFARTVFQGGIHMGVAYTAFAAAFLIVMAEQAGEVFCPGQAKEAAGMFRGGSLVILLAVLSLYFARYLALVGRRLLVMISVGIADLVYLAASLLLTSAGKAGVLSFVYAGLLGMGILTFLLGALCCRQLHLRADWLQILVIPTGGACVTGLVCMLLGRLFTPHLGNLVTLFATLVISCTLYWVILLLVRNFREQELETVTGGKLLHAMGQMLRVF